MVNHGKPNKNTCRVTPDVAVTMALKRRPEAALWRHMAGCCQSAEAPVPRCGPWGQFQHRKRTPPEIRSSKTGGWHWHFAIFCWRWGLNPQKMTSGQLICFCFAKRTFSKNTWCFSRQTLEFDEQEMCFNDQTWWGSYMVLPCLANQASVGALEDV